MGRRKEGRGMAAAAVLGSKGGAGTCQGSWFLISNLYKHCTRCRGVASRRWWWWRDDRRRRRQQKTTTTVTSCLVLSPKTWVNQHLCPKQALERWFTHRREVDLRGANYKRYSSRAFYKFEFLDKTLGSIVLYFWTHH